MRSPANLTITTRTASKFCARTRSECPHTIFISSNSGVREPCSECQSDWSPLLREGGISTAPGAHMKIEYSRWPKRAAEASHGGFKRPKQSHSVWLQGQSCLRACWRWSCHLMLVLSSLELASGQLFFNGQGCSCLWTCWGIVTVWIVFSSAACIVICHLMGKVTIACVLAVG